MAKKINANPLFTAQALLLASLSLGACAQGTGLAPSTSTMDAQSQAQGQNKDGTPAADATPLKAFNRFPDIPVPTKASMDMRRTLVFGSGDTWYGQLGQDTGHSSDAMFDFYKQELPGFGWLEVTSVRAPVSVLTYERQKRILSIQIEPASLVGSKVTLTVSPRVGGTPTMN
ncbi:hypothetical protein [Magnetovibrio blakemorei]|uniref:Lipoprotein n=1 Tax=Magnetovibrio blakemorei TaxID=28181 RepID=A0A1E5QA42_9PROT|nr:hypothetical protein [Magnetovibrio blakemorei]OEJ68649.1 hypothetical protein BEN30_05375 [Magnetovibrio blakemorei]